jgi:hypothetical protein
MINAQRFPVFAIRCPVSEVDVGDFGPGEALDADVDFTTHTRNVLSSSFETTEHML